jgi:hypothetical protein
MMEGWRGPRGCDEGIAICGFAATLKCGVRICDALQKKTAHQVEDKVEDCKY